MQCMRAACVLASVRWIAKFLTFPLKIPHFQNFSTDRWVDCLIEQNDEHALTRWMACLWPIQCIRAACALVSVRWIAKFQTLPLKMPPPGAHFPKSCNGQVSQLLDATERFRCFGIIYGVFVTHTLHVYCLHTPRLIIDWNMCNVRWNFPFWARNIRINLKGEKPALYCHNKTQRHRIGRQAADILSYYSRMGSFTRPHAL